MVYGYEVKGINDRKVIAAKNMMQLSSKMALPGAILVNDLPFREFSLYKWKYSMLIHTSTTYS